MIDQATLAHRWQQRARRTMWKANLGWWLDQTGPLLIGSGVLGFALLFWLRTRGQSLDLQNTGLICLGGLALVFAVGALLARRQFLSTEQALIRLESQLHLHNALTCAALGRSPWPELPVQTDDGWQWRWSRVAGPLLACVGSLTLALSLPISAVMTPPLPTVQPQAWQQMDEWLEKLEQEKIITPEEKQEQAAKIEALRDQPQEKWFSHESLNAGDTLKEQLQQEIAQMSQNMAQAERSLNALQNYANQLSQQAKEQLLKDFDEALSGLKDSALDLDPELMKELAQIDPNNLPSMSKEQLDQLREALKQKAQAGNGMCENPGFLGDGEGADDELAEMLGQLREGQGAEGSEPGKGDATRGPGSAPLTLSKEENNFGTNKNEAVSNKDLSRAQLGTTLGLQDGKHEVDQKTTGPTAAGSTANKGQGGEQVWRESLTPEEKAVLKRVFE